MSLPAFLVVRLHFLSKVWLVTMYLGLCPLIIFNQTKTSTYDYSLRFIFLSDAFRN